MGHPAVAVLIGGVLVLALYLVPVLGFLVFKLLGLLGLGAVAYTVILAARTHQAAKDVPRNSTAPPGATASSGRAASSGPAGPMPETHEPPLTSSGPPIDAAPATGGILDPVRDQQRFFSYGVGSPAAVGHF